MKLFLTSNIGGSIKVDGKRVPTRLCEDNDLLKNIKDRWTDNSKVLIVGGAADDTAVNDSIRNIFVSAFAMSDLMIDKMNICDNRNLGIIEDINDYDAVILTGGHVPTQNKFFEDINLKKYLKDYQGIVIGISAGSMNCADTVYAQPELDGESIDPNYRRFIKGLGITKYNVLPHYQDIKDDMLDEKRLFEDITYADSYGQRFYTLEDGSYILIENEAAILYGAAYLISEGKMEKICDKGDRYYL